jgi:hypothetical protein
MRESSHSNKLFFDLDCPIPDKSGQASRAMTVLLTVEPQWDLK